MKSIHYIPAICFILLLSACAATFDSEFDYNHDIDFDALKTYSWFQGSRDNEQKQQTNELIKQAVVAELAKKGLQLANTRPDFTIALYFGSKNKITRKSGTTRLYYYGKSGGDAYNISDDRKGSLTIDFFEPTSKKFIWRGTTRAELKNVNTDEERLNLINGAVQSILKNFPPPAKK
jgi:hypothetical protein